MDPPLAAPPPAVLYPVYQEPAHVQPYDSCMLSYHYLTPPWMAGHAPSHAQPRPHSSYCPSHLAYVSAPPTHHTPASISPPTQIQRAQL